MSGVNLALVCNMWSDRKKLSLEKHLPRNHATLNNILINVACVAGYGRRKGKNLPAHAANVSQLTPIITDANPALENVFQSKSLNLCPTLRIFQPRNLIDPRRRPIDLHVFNKTRWTKDIRSDSIIYFRSTQRSLLFWNINLLGLFSFFIKKSLELETKKTNETKNKIQ